MRHAEITPELGLRIKAWQASGYGKTMASLALDVSLPKINLAAPGYWGRKQLPKGLLRRLRGDYFVPPMMAGLHERFKRFVDKEPQIELELVYRLLSVDARQFPVVGRWLHFEQDRVKARRTLANTAWRIWESYRDCGKEVVPKPVPSQLVGSRWYEKHPEWVTRNQKPMPSAREVLARLRATQEQVARDKIVDAQRLVNQELGDLLLMTKPLWSNNGLVGTWDKVAGSPASIL